MEFVLHGVTVRISGDRVTYGARTYHKDALPGRLRNEINLAVRKEEAALTASSKSPAKRKSHEYVSTSHKVTATGKQPRKNPRT